jgi:chromosome segregation ATPase
MSLQVPRQLPSQQPQITPQNGSVPTATTTPLNRTGTPNTPPVVQQKVPKSEFERLTNEWNETHGKLTENFRELNVIFADIKFLLQQLESQLEAAGIKSDLSHCVAAADSCIESFANANANASSLDMHIKKLDKNVFSNAPQDLQETFKKLTTKVAEAGNLGKAIGIPGVAQNVSGTQSTSPTAQLSSGIQGCKDLLPEIEKNLSKIESDINSVSGKIKGLKDSPHLLAEVPQKIRENSEKLFRKYKTTKDLFDEEKKKNDTAKSLGTLPSQTDQRNYQLKLVELRNQSSDVIFELIDMLKKLEDTENKTKSMSVNLNQLGDDNNKINSLIKQTSSSIYGAHIDLNDSLQKINQSNLGKKGKKDINELKTTFTQKDNTLKIHRAKLQLIDDEFTRLNKFSVEMSEKNADARYLCEEAIRRLQNELSGLIWM